MDVQKRAAPGSTAADNFCTVNAEDCGLFPPLLSSEMNLNFLSSTTMSDKMEYVRLGNSGLQVSKPILGCMSYGSSKWQSWVLDEEESIKHIEAAWALGINAFDTSNTYSNGESERILGKALRKIDCPREDYVILTKVYFGVSRDISDVAMGKPHPVEGFVNRAGLSRKHIFESVKASLERLGMDYIDVLQCHRFDTQTPIAETMQALHDVVQAGYVRYIGMSSCYAFQFQMMQNYAATHNLTQFISMQNQISAVYREEEREMLKYCHLTGVGCIPWSPLARGFLARPASEKKSTRAGTDRMIGQFSTEADTQINSAVENIAKARNVSMAQIALAYVANKKEVSAPLIGSTHIDSIKELVEACRIKLTEEEIKKIETPYKARAIIGFA